MLRTEMKTKMRQDKKKAGQTQTVTHGREASSAETRCIAYAQGTTGTNG